MGYQQGLLGLCKISFTKLAKGRERISVDLGGHVGKWGGEGLTYEPAVVSALV